MTEQNSNIIKVPPENETFGNKVNFLYDQLTRGVMLINSKCEKSVIDNYWGKIRDSFESMTFFNLDYLYDTFRCYFQWLEFSSQKSISPVILGILLQRIAGRGKSFGDSARIARADLLEIFKMPECFCDHIYEIIASSNSINYGEKSYWDIFLHLNLVRLAAPRNKFIENQERIQTDAIHLTKKEFYKFQRAIYSKLLSQHCIFENMFFWNLYETNARANLREYLVILDAKIKSVEFLELLPANNPSKEKVGAFKIQNNPINNGEYVEN